MELIASCGFHNKSFAGQHSFSYALIDELRDGAEKPFTMTDLLRRMLARFKVGQASRMKTPVHLTLNREAFRDHIILEPLPQPVTGFGMSPNTILRTKRNDSYSNIANRSGLRSIWHSNI